jgi:hypothetical protein
VWCVSVIGREESTRDVDASSVQGEATDFYSDSSRKGWETQLSINLAPVILRTQLDIHTAMQKKRDVVVLNTALLAGEGQSRQKWIPVDSTSYSQVSTRNRDRLSMLRSRGQSYTWHAA